MINMKYLHLNETKWIITLLFNVFCAIFTMSAQDTSLISLGPERSIYQFQVKDIDGKDFEFSCLEGKKILIVNTGSKCMYRQQLSDLQKLYEKYADKDFVVVVFPCNNFFFREPKKNSWIKKHYQKKYGIKFPIMAKTVVKGDKIDPVYDFLSYKVKNGKFDAAPKWNFQKYLIDRQGFLYKSVNPATNPLDKEIIDWIETEN
jgi:glutathione peroxidase